MSNNKLSSIDTLWNAIPKDVKLKMPFGIYEDIWVKHREEIKEAYWNGSDGIEPKTEILKVAENYYNETFGVDK